MDIEQARLELDHLDQQIRNMRDAIDQAAQFSDMPHEMWSQLQNDLDAMMASVVSAKGDMRPALRISSAARPIINVEIEHGGMLSEQVEQAVKEQIRQLTGLEETP